MSDTLGGRVRQRREELGLTLGDIRGLIFRDEDIKDYPGCCIEVLQSVEEGSMVPLPAMIIALCHALDCSADWLLGLPERVFCAACLTDAAMTKESDDE
jgi:transcriptional regulator with XRE-family HTH domain